MGIVTVGRLSVGEITVSYPDNPELVSRSIDLPFQRGSKDKVTRFVIDANVTLSQFSSSILRLSPDECIESITVNGGNPHDLSKLDEDNRCYPYSYIFNADGEMHHGVNTISTEITNKEGYYGIERITPMLSQSAALVVAALIWAAVYAAFHFFFASCRAATLPSRDSALRQLARCSLPTLGLFMIATQLLNAWDSVPLLSQPFVFFAATAVQAALLLRLLDGLRDRPLAYRPSLGWASLSLLAFTILAPMSLLGYKQIPRLLLTLLGILAGVLAVTPTFATLHRARRIPAAVAIAALAAALPLAYDQFRLALWEISVAPTTHAVAAIVSALGWNASTHYGDTRWNNGDIQDYHGYVTTPDFSVQIGAQCGGFEGMTLFLFLLASYVLLDWRFFSRTNKLWLPFVATIPYLFIVNVLRIAAILVYALLIGGEVDQNAARQAAVEMFHSNAGWVIYSLAFGPYLWSVYWLARRKR
jgi:exosortase/archaeosortase family protein